MVYDNAYSLSYTILLKNQSANLIFFAYVPVRQNLSRQTRCLPRSCIHASCLPWAVTPIRDSYKCKIPLRHMSVSVQQYVPGMQRRKLLFVINMSMCGIDCRLPFRNHTVIR